MHVLLRHRRRLCLVLPMLAALAGPATAGRDVSAVPLEEPESLVAGVLRLADERLALMPSVAATKWIHRRGIEDAAREQAVIEGSAAQAARAGLAREPVARLFELQIRLARDLQKGLHAQWARDGFDAPPVAPSLADTLRPRLDRLTTAMIEALYVAAPALGDGERLQAVAREVLPATRWPPAARDELLASLASVRLDAARSLDRARGVGVLRIGTPADYAPFSALSDGRIDGSDVALALRLSTALGLRPVFLHTSWSSLLRDLADDRFDIAIGGISVSDARRAVAAFSLPVARSGKTAVGRCTDGARLASLNAIDRAEVQIVENPGGTNEGFARRTVHAASVHIHPDNRTIFDELLAGRADVMFTDETEVTLAIRHHRELCRLLAEAYEITDKAFLLPREPAWAAAIDGWLGPELGRGVPAELLQDYLGR